MMRPDAKVEKVYLYPKPVDFRKSIDGLAALVELDIKVAVFRPCAFRLPQQATQPREDFVLGAQRLLSLAQAPRIRAI
ncbi:IS66 family insertion sequence element accessory protein TnpB [Pseudomonas sp. PDM10]|uniref:IS66 family insertion sequence element accessory protein TnpB n=1 Tax=Pseudomonas sp. PDM10 TaxID=2769269 RepID=UPI00298CB1A6|nr:IS66 family insertion sequence element accessory protein TnpB [Pseudomonas sp. PDM10]